MKNEYIAWCEKGEDNKLIYEYLDCHLASVALIANLAYLNDWIAFARRTKAPLWLLTAAGLLHDVGKAIRQLQESALEACRRGWKPNFAFHEYASATLPLVHNFLLNQKLNKKYKYSLALAVSMHHHGMYRMDLGSRIIPLGEAIRSKRLGTHKGPLLRDVLTRDGYRDMIYVYEKARNIFNKIIINEKLFCKVDYIHNLVPPPIQLEEKLSYILIKNAEEAWRILMREHKGGGLVASITYTLAGMISVADSFAASYGRRRKGVRGYAARVLDELGVLEMAKEIIEKIYNNYCEI